jgi:Uma2 family endonuclease
MTTRARHFVEPKIDYADSDGQPIADNTLQFRWIVTIEGGLDDLFSDRADVFVAGDLLWYPEEGSNTIRTAPDALVVFGRPKGYRGSYRQWEEQNIAPQVVWEVWSPGNRRRDFVSKFEFYQKYGVEEYYWYDPDRIVLRGWLRKGTVLKEIKKKLPWVSPLLGVRMQIAAGELEILRPDGAKFLSYVELAKAKEEAAAAASAASATAAAERRARTTAEAQVERLAAQLRALGIEPKS